MARVSPDFSKVRVLVRIRPFLPSERDEKCVRVIPPVHPAKESTAIELFDKIMMQVTQYQFDGTYDEHSTQEGIYSQQVPQMLEACFQGINSTIFAYGMTGSGKTYTMQGEGRFPGIIPRLATDLFTLALSKGLKKGTVSMQMAFLEIYNEKIRDLLNIPGPELIIREDKANSIIIKGLTWHCLTEPTHFSEFYARGCQNRTTATTSFNANSSRSHAFVILKVETTDGMKLLTSKVHLIDLAGSEDNRLVCS
jgi:kinesin family protein 22